MSEVAFSIFAVEGLELFAFAFESFVGVRLAFEKRLVDDILQSVQEVATRTTPVLVLVGSLRHLDVGAVDELLFAQIQGLVGLDLVVSLDGRNDSKGVRSRALLLLSLIFYICK